jgi:hypothetical protein
VQESRLASGRLNSSSQDKRNPQAKLTGALKPPGYALPR